MFGEAVVTGKFNTKGSDKPLVTPTVLLFLVPRLLCWTALQPDLLSGPLRALSFYFIVPEVRIPRDVSVTE